MLSWVQEYNMTTWGQWSTKTVTRTVATSRFWLQCTKAPHGFQVSEWCVWTMWRRKVSAARFPSFCHVVAYLSLCRIMSENPVVHSVAVPQSTIQARPGAVLHMTAAFLFKCFQQQSLCFAPAILIVHAMLTRIATHTKKLTRERKTQRSTPRVQVKRKPYKVAFRTLQGSVQNVRKCEKKSHNVAFRACSEEIIM